MRKTLLLAVLMPLAAVASEPADTTIIMNNRHIVVNDSAGITRVSVYDNDGTQLTRTYETSFTDGQEVERVYVTSPFIPQTLGKNRKPMGRAIIRFSSWATICCRTERWASVEALPCTHATQSRGNSDSRWRVWLSGLAVILH